MIYCFFFFTPFVGCRNDRVLRGQMAGEMSSAVDKRSTALAETRTRVLTNCT